MYIDHRLMIVYVFTHINACSLGKLALRVSDKPTKITQNGDTLIVTEWLLNLPICYQFYVRSFLLQNFYICFVSWHILIRNIKLSAISDMC